MPQKGSVTRMARAFPRKPERTARVEVSCLLAKPISGRLPQPKRFARMLWTAIATRQVRARVSCL